MTALEARLGHLPLRVLTGQSNEVIVLGVFHQDDYPRTRRRRFQFTPDICMLFADERELYIAGGAAIAGYDCTCELELGDPGMIARAVEVVRRAVLEYYERRGRPTGAITGEQ